MSLFITAGLLSLQLHINISFPKYISKSKDNKGISYLNAETMGLSLGTVP